MQVDGVEFAFFHQFTLIYSYILYALSLFDGTPLCVWCLTGVINQKNVTVVEPKEIRHTPICGTYEIATIFIGGASGTKKWLGQFWYSFRHFSFLIKFRWGKSSFQL